MKEIKYLEKIMPKDQRTAEKAALRMDQLIKPQGSLGKLEELAIQLAGIYRTEQPMIQKKALLVLCGDHGVVEENIASAPSAVTILQSVNIARGVTGVGAMAKHLGIQTMTIDIGVDTNEKMPGVMDCKIATGTKNIAKGKAMTREQAIQAIHVGIDMAEKAVKEGANILAIGEMGIGNTTPSTAILAAITGKNPQEITGVGANFPVEQLPHKAAVIQQALNINQPDPSDPLDLLSKLGGYDIAGMTGVILGAAIQQVPVCIDGYISTISAILAKMIAPDCIDYMVPSHKSIEKGARLASETLGIQPFFDLNMRLGEGSGAVLSIELCETACVVLRDMITFKEAGIGVV